MRNVNRKKAAYAIIKPLSQSSRNIKDGDNSFLMQTRYPSTSLDNGHCSNNNTLDIVSLLQEELHHKKALIESLKAINSSYKEEAIQQKAILNSILAQAEQTSSPLQLSHDQITQLREASHINDLNVKVRDLTIQLQSNREELNQLKAAYDIDSSYGKNCNDINALRYENHSVKFRLANMSRKYRDISDDHYSLTEKMKKVKKCLRLIKAQSKEKEIFAKRIYKGVLKGSSRKMLSTYRNQVQSQSSMTMPSDRLPSKNETNLFQLKVKRDNENGMDLSKEAGTDESFQAKDLKLKYARKNILYLETKGRYDSILKERNEIEKELVKAKDSNAFLIKDNKKFKQALSDTTRLIESYNNDIDAYQKEFGKLKEMIKRFNKPAEKSIQCQVESVQYIRRRGTNWEPKLKEHRDKGITYAAKGGNKKRGKRLLKVITSCTYQYTLSDSLESKEQLLKRIKDLEDINCNLNEKIASYSKSIDERKSNRLRLKVEPIISLNYSTKKDLIANKSHNTLIIQLKKEEEEEKKKESLSQPLLITQLTSNTPQELSSLINELQQGKDQLTSLYESSLKEIAVLKEDKQLLLNVIEEKTRVYYQLGTTHQEALEQCKAMQLELGNNQSRQAKGELTSNEDTEMRSHIEHLTKRINQLEKEKINHQNDELTLKNQSSELKEASTRLKETKTNLLIQTSSDMKVDYLCNKKNLRASTPSSLKEIAQSNNLATDHFSHQIHYECNAETIDDYLNECEVKLNDEMIKSNVLKTIAKQEQMKYRKVKAKYHKAKGLLLEQKQSDNHLASIEGQSLLSILPVKHRHVNQEDNSREDKRSVQSERSSFLTFSNQVVEQRRETAKFIDSPIVDLGSHQFNIDDSKLSKRSPVSERDKTSQIESKVVHSKQMNRLISFKARKSINDNPNDK